MSEVKERAYEIIRRWFSETGLRAEDFKPEELTVLRNLIEDELMKFEWTKEMSR